MSVSELVEAPAKSLPPQIRNFRRIFRFPDWRDAGLAALCAVLMIAAFPDFDLWFLAWFALAPLLLAIERNKDSVFKSFWLGWLAGTLFFFGSCWWLTHAPIKYAGMPAVVAYILLLIPTLGAGFFVGLFSAGLSRLLLRFGGAAIFAAPFLWAATEWMRLWLTGNAWNALGYSQAFNPSLIQFARFGGVFSIGFLLVGASAAIVYLRLTKFSRALPVSLAVGSLISCVLFASQPQNQPASNQPAAVVVALQPVVPMSGLSLDEYYFLRERHVEMAEKALDEIESRAEWQNLPRVVVFPESPMNFTYQRDSEFREFAQSFAARNRVSLVFNGWEPALAGEGLTNSAVMVNRRGAKIAQYDKIRLVPFGEYVPAWLPLAEYIGTVAGRSVPGKNVHLMPFGDVRAGVMICYESAFGDIAAADVQNGADVLVELTNDGYSGETPILRQHLANAVFRAVETNRPLLRVTNTGISARISERGEIFDQTRPAEVATRIWTIGKSNAGETFYVRYGDWFAAICAILSLIFLTLTFRRKQQI